MATEIILPALGETMESAAILRWLVAEGDQVEKGQPLVEIETDKAVLEVESSTAGTVLRLIGRQGETYDVLEVIGYVGEPGEAVPEAAPKKPTRKREAKAAPPAPQAKRPAPRSEAVHAVHVPRADAEAAEAPRHRLSPRARKLAGEWLLDTTQLAGSGPGGRVVEADVQAAIDERGLGPQTFTPAARELARNTGATLDELLRLAGGATITVEVVERALKTRPQPLSPMRRIIAERMTQSARTIPSFAATMNVDMEAVARAREAHPGLDGKKPSYNDYVVAACAAALRAMPIVNARCIETPDGAFSVQMNDAVHIGVAVALDEGLVVPVIRDADKRSIEKIAIESRRLAERARAKALGPDEMGGGTFTITNMGMLGVESFAAIIYPEQGAILAVGAVEDAAVAHEGGISVRKRMRLTLSCDHRIIDGAVGARFLGLVRTTLETYGGSDPS
ncbi:MAG: 2-oxo acid dehydrogenase subunit E2 [Verrucomicrobia bacterium]|nr:2-oxo acid dehydrogenase subunit E2 [Verrucomicrobiota bacterium]